jgi:tellurite resistance protein TerC
MDKSLLMWGGFFTIVITLLALDLGVFHKQNREISFKESLWMSTFYVCVGVLFGGWVWHELGSTAFAEYMTGFLVEKSLSLDNIFLISVIFSSLSIPLKYQHRVLFWGIVGVIVLRAVMIGLGVHILNNFGWVLYLFAAFLIITGIKMFFLSDEVVDINNNVLLKWMRRHLPITDQLHGQKFFVVQMDPKINKKKVFYTPLFLALVTVEFVDLIFAVDSIPAIFTITQDPYIVYTSNIFAILGLRALYFALASIIKRFYYLKYALAMVLIFIGSKVFVADLLGLEKVPALLSLGVTLGLLTAGCVYSVIKTPKSLK